MNHTPWHVTDEDLAGHTATTLAPVHAASVEAHVASCARCRQRLAAMAPPEEVEAAWLALADRIDRPSPGLFGRLRHAGGRGLLLATVATPPMLAAAVGAVLLVAVVPLLTALVAGEAALLVLLVAAPLAPVAAVGLAYREAADPAGEIGLATPRAGLRLVAARAVVVSLGALAATVATLAVVRVWVDVPASLFSAWLLPGLALSALVLLSGTTRVDPARVAAGLALAWAVVVATGSTVRRSLRPEAVLDVLDSPALQTAALTVAVAALVLTVARRDLVSYRRTA